MSSSSSFKKGINCFNCSYEGHYAHECRKPKRQDGGNVPKAWLTALEVHESDLGDIRESDRDHPNTEEQTESPQNPVGNVPELMDLMDLYSVIDKEGEDNELVGYLGAMHPIEETISGSDDEIVYCRAMDATCGDRPQLLSADSRRTPSAIAAVNYPSTMAWCEFDRGWDAYEHTEVYSDWAVAQKKLGSMESRTTALSRAVGRRAACL